MTTTTYTYPDAIIYGIKCDETKELYIGSTVGGLEQRMSVHRHGATVYNTWVTNGSVGKRPNRCYSIQIMNRGNYTVVQIERCPCNTKTELCLREGDIQLEYKSSIGTLCINNNIAGAHARAGGIVEYDKQYQKQYQKHYATQYRKDNLDTIREQKKQWYKANVDTIREQSKQYNQKNATKIAAREGVKHDCGVCGGRYTYTSKAKHFRTQKHQRAMQSDTQASAHHD
jgi:hypothetical protein